MSISVAKSTSFSDRSCVVVQLREILAWMDANGEPFAAAHINQAIEVMDPTPFVTFSENDSCN